jgi:hypothetical protein
VCLHSPHIVRLQRAVMVGKQVVSRCNTQPTRTFARSCRTFRCMVALTDPGCEEFIAGGMELRGPAAVCFHVHSVTRLISAIVFANVGRE